MINHNDNCGAKPYIRMTNYDTFFYQILVGLFAARYNDTLATRAQQRALFSMGFKNLEINFEIENSR